MLDALPPFVINRICGTFSGHWRHRRKNIGGESRTLELQKRSGYANERVVTVATCIERERKRHDWTYRELGVRLGVSGSTAHGWATGDIEPNLANLRRIAKRLRIDLAVLVGAA